MRRWLLLLPCILAFGLLLAVSVVAQEPAVWLSTRMLFPLHTLHQSTILIVANDGPTVLGDTTTFTATVSQGNSFSYTWDLGDGSHAIGSVVTYTYLEVGSYTATVTATNGVLTFVGETIVAVDIPVATPLLREGFGGFDFLPPDWLLSMLTDGQHWRLASDQVHSGAYSAFHDDDVGMQDAWLVAPQVTPTVESQLVFWQFENYDHAYYKHSVWVSTGSRDPKDADFVELADLGPGVEEQWEEVWVDLDDCAGQPIYLAFRYEGDFADEWYIDDVQVTVELVASHNGPKAPGEVVTLTANVATGSNVGYFWNLGSGEIRNGAVVTYIYAAPGDHTAIVTASNSVSAITRTLTVPIRTYVYLPLLVRDYLPSGSLHFPSGGPHFH